jgi:hypothetical protein
VTGNSDRRRTIEGARPTRDWWAEERERVLAGEMSDPLKASYAESMKLSPRFAAEYRGFWDLPEDFEFEIDTPDCPVPHAEPGKITPADTSEQLASEPGIALRCDCGHEFGPPSRNWKMDAMVEVRGSGDWVESREYSCPGCGRLLHTETLPPRYPVVHEVPA